MFRIACTLYNNTIHTSTNLKPRELFYGMKDGEERPLNTEQMLEARNKLYDENVIKIAETQNKQHRYHNISREEPPLLEEGKEVQNKTQGIKSKTKEQFQTVRVSADGIQTYEDHNERKLHKAKMRRVRE